MRFSLLSSAWTAYLASNMPCHPNYLTWSRQDVIPRPFFNNRNITEDPRNIIPMPMQLNNIREMQPFVDTYDEGRVIYSCSRCPNPGICKGSAILSSMRMIPPDIFKGPIARSVLYSATKHPKIAETIDKKVLNIETAIQWDSKFPMTRSEKEWIDSHCD